jgi:lipoate-protein ligase A
MLRCVAATSIGESLRLYTPDNASLFSSLDARRPGYAEAIAHAEQAGFPPLIRLAGGQAALFLEESVAFAWATPDPDARLHIRPRFEQVSHWIMQSLRRLGLDARVGPVAGEYCHGEYSVNIAGRVKVMGVGQRVIRGAAHIGGVITISQTQILRDTLGPIYRALDVEFDPKTAGGISDFDAALGPAEVIEAMCVVLRESGYVLEPQRFDESIRKEAEALIPLHEPNPQRARSASLRAARRDRKTLIQEHAPVSTRDSRETDDS